jgi:poly-gamma-glutamate synthesis protein (capsule biosynthesis protein)
VYRGRLVVYGCGDLIDDYEGIVGHEEYRDDLRLLYLVLLEPGTGGLRDVWITPLQARRMRLRHVSYEDGQWLRGVLERISRGFGSHVGSKPDGTLTLRWS